MVKLSGPICYWSPTLQLWVFLESNASVERRVGRGTKPTFSYDENKWWVSRSLYPPYFNLT
ncbi:MAG: hypothetical protein KAI83_10530 [Thiomargarita sp.]|nr:hypothetical protein [Thiomargarita sp.]